jgi:hypothetical protein
MQVGRNAAQCSVMQRKSGQSRATTPIETQSTNSSTKASPTALHCAHEFDWFDFLDAVAFGWKFRTQCNLRRGCDITSLPHAKEINQQVFGERECSKEYSQYC